MMLINNSRFVASIISLLGGERGTLEPIGDKGVETLLRLGRANIIAKEAFVRFIGAPKAERGGAAFSLNDAFDIERGNDARGQALVVEKVGLADHLNGDESTFRSVRHGHQFAATSNPDIPFAI